MYTHKHTHVRVQLVNDVASVLRAIKGMSLVTLHRVAPERSVVRGSGARAFIPGDTPLARSTNIVTIACGGEAGGVLTHLGPECVFIGTAPMSVPSSALLIPRVSLSSSFTWLSYAIALGPFPRLQILCFSLRTQCSAYILPCVHLF